MRPILPRLAAAVLVSLGLLCGGRGLGEAATYYVSRGEAGTPLGSPGNSCLAAQNLATPKLTIMQGIACMTNAGGDAVLIRTGTYDQRVDTAIKSGSSQTNRNLIAAYNNETVVLKATGSNCVLALSSPTSSRTFLYLTFDGLIIDGVGGTGYGICQPETFGDGTIGHNIYRNGEIRNTHYSGMSGLNQFDEVHHMLIHDNGLTNATPQSHGMYVCAMDTLIHDNEFYHNGAYGVQFYYSGAQAVGCSSRSKIYNNKIYDNAAITLTGGQSAGGIILCCGDSNEVYNNLIYNNGRSGSFPGHGLQIGYSGPHTNLKIYNNTIYNNKNDGIFILSGVPAVTVKNNIVYGNGGSSFHDLSGNTPTMDSSNLTLNPNFTNSAATPPNLTPLAPSAAIDTGVAYNALSFDMQNAPRPSGGAMDKGAIEVQQTTPDPGLGTYYVAQTGGLDSRTCAQAQDISTPRATIAGGLGCLTVGGSTLLIKAGIYPEKIDTATVTLPGGTDWAHATTIAAYGGDSVTLQWSGAGVGLYFRDPTNSHYIVLDRLTVDGNNQANTNGFACTNGAHHIRFQNGEIRETFYEPVYFNNGANCEVLHSTLHDWLTLSGVHALGAVSGTILRGNTLYNGPAAGIKIDANETGTALSGVVIDQNIVHHVGATQNLAALLLGGTGNVGLLVRNNLVYASYRGIEIVTGTPSAKVLNNTVYQSTTTGIQINSGAVTTQVKNNLSVNNGGIAIDDASGQMVPATNQTTDPSFVDAAGGDFGLQSISTAIDAGTMLAPDVVFDLPGITRSDYRGYDIGAYEFTGTVSGAPSDVLGPPRRGSARQSSPMFQPR